MMAGPLWDAPTIGAGRLTTLQRFFYMDAINPFRVPPNPSQSVNSRS